MADGHLAVHITARGTLELSQGRTSTDGHDYRLPESRHVNVVPKGLRSFDEHDADFFLELLPDPGRSEKLPKSIRFWKTRIEETDPDRTFRVGLIYGPSGWGKSSLVSRQVLVVLS